MSRRKGERGGGNIGCLIWLAVMVVTGYCLYIILPVKVTTSRFEDFMKEEAGFGSIKTVAQIQKDILAKAKELNIPLTKENLTIVHTNETITVEARYEMVLDFFGGSYKYVWKFDPVIKRPLFAV